MHLFRSDANIKSFRDYVDKKVTSYERPTLKELMSSGTVICQTV